MVATSTEISELLSEDVTGGYQPGVNLNIITIDGRMRIILTRGYWLRNSCSRYLEEVRGLGPNVHQLQPTLPRTRCSRAQVSTILRHIRGRAQE